MTIDYPAIVPAMLLRDNNMEPSFLNSNGLTSIELGTLLDRFNDRLNELEKDVRLLQQPSGSVSWAKR